MKIANLIYSVGSRDVQVVVRQDGVCSCYPINQRGKDKSLRNLLDDLADGKIEYDAISPKQFYEMNIVEESSSIEYSREKQLITFSGHKPDISVPLTRLSICFPIFSKIFRDIKKEYSDFRVKKVLILHTSRNRNHKFGSKEPAKAFYLMRKIVAEAFEIEKDDVIDGCFAKEYDEIDVKTHSDKMLVKKVSVNIFKSISSIFETINSDSIIFLSENGGLPMVSTFIRETVSFLFKAPQIKIISATEGTESFALANKQKVNPTAKLNAFRNMKELAVSGALEAALGIAKKEECDNEKKIVSEYLREVVDVVYNGKLPESQMSNFLINKTFKEFSADFSGHILRQLFILTLNFRQNSYIKALQNLFTLHDIVSWQFVSKHLTSKNSKSPCVDFISNKFYPANANLNKEAVEELSSICYESYYAKEGVHLGYKISKDNSDKNQFRSVFLLEILKKYLPDKYREFLEDFSDKLRGDKHRSLARDARNASTHGMLDAHRLSLAIEETEKNGFHIFSKTKDNNVIFAAPLMIKLCELSNINNPAEIFNEFLQSIDSDLIKLVSAESS